MPGSYFGRFVVAFVAVLVASSLLINIFPSVSDQYKQLPVDQLEVITTAERNLKYLAGRSENAHELLKFYRDHAVLCWTDSAGQIVKSGRQMSRKTFFVNVNPVPVLDGQTKPVLSTYDPKTNVLSLRDSSLSPNVLAIVFAQQLVHAYEREHYGQPPAQPPSPKWLRGEMSAHLTVSWILNQYSEGQWARLVRYSLSERESLLIVANREPYTFTLGLAPGDSLRLVRMFGPLTHHDLSVLKAQLSYDTNVICISYQYPLTRYAEGIDKLLAEFYLPMYQPIQQTSENLYIIR